MSKVMLQNEQERSTAGARRGKKTDDVKHLTEGNSELFATEIADTFYMTKP